jgi:competence protein ComEA
MEAAMNRFAALGIAVAATLASLARVWTASAPTPELVTVSCERAVLVDGLLRCDDEVPASVAELCGSADLPALPIRSGDVIETEAVCTGQAAVGRMQSPDLVALRVAVDINRASPEELSSLPRIGPAIAERIVAGRPYRSVDGLLEVRGIGPKTLATIRDRVRVDPASVAAR